MALADLLGTDQGMVSRYVSGTNKPGPDSCLLLAALSASASDREFWWKASGITAQQTLMLRDLFAVATSDQITSEERALIEWWRRPASPIEQNVKVVVETVLKTRQPKTATSAP